MLYPLHTQTPQTPTAALVNDTGSSSSDGISSMSSITISDLVDGNTWSYSTDGGANWIIGDDIIGTTVEFNPAFVFSGSFDDDISPLLSTTSAGTFEGINTIAPGLTIDKVLNNVFFFDITMPANLTNDKEALFEIGGASSGLVIFTENGSLKTTIAGGNDESELTVAGILEAGKSYWVVMEMRGTDGDSTNNTLSYFVGEKQENAPIRFTAFNTDYQPWTGVDWTGTDAGGWGMVNGAVQGPADVSYASFSGTFNEGRFYSNQTFAALWKTAGTSSESFTFRQSNNNNTNHSQASAALSLTRDNVGPAVNTAEATSATSIELTLTEAFTERDTVAASDFVLTVQDVDSPPTVSSILILGTTITLNLSEDLIVDLDSTVTLAYTMSQNGGSLQDHTDNRLADFSSQAVNIDALSVDSV